ncbi:MFS transporter [Demequina activiva]|uniref:MFS transporter n=1 Tax=Demequina activiva TaxID=1582364 RepID=A0A919UJ10_9MICO|nr:MFS transporter [Demequina activiva]GIG53906.1 MFS transporter [Demequina activiva]
MRQAARTAVPRAAWAVFGAAAFIYFVAVVQRTALGVAGVEALERFGVEAIGLSMLSVVQISVYASLQLPAGAMLDRIGPRRVLAIGSLTMGAGQLMLAFTDSIWLALAARVLIGAGDAPVFIAATRLVSEWFPPRRAPLMVQITGTLGQIGQLASAIPVAFLLHQQGWSITFATLAALGLAAAAMSLWRVRMPEQELPHHAVPSATGAQGEVAPAAPAIASAGGAQPSLSMRDAIRPPGVKLGFWTHWTGLFSANTVALLWGVPFFVQGQGQSTAGASALLTLLVCTNITAAPIIGTLTARHPLRRSWLILGGAAMVTVAWAAILIPDTPRPWWQLALLIIALGFGGPVSLVGMDYARTFGPRGRLGTATGFVNIGGFAATVLSVLLVGAVLQIVSPGDSDYSLDDYRIALAAMAVPMAIGVTGVLVSRRRTRTQMAEQGIVVPPVRQAWRDGRRL